MKLRETDIGAAVSRYLEAQGWAVYPEVQLRSYHGPADIIALRDGVLWAIECKTQMNYKLLSQAWSWRKYADQLSVAMPEAWRMRSHLYDASEDFQAILLERLGFGLFGVRDGVVAQFRGPVFLPREKDDFLHVVNPGHRIAEAGQNCGKRFTALDVTMAHLLEYVKEHPGIALREAVSNIRHHYANNRSAMGALPKFLDSRSGAASRCPEIVLVSRHGRLCCDLAEVV